MFSSIHIRDLLVRQNNDPLRRARRNPHRTVQPDSAAVPGPDEFRLSGRWQVQSEASPHAESAATDLREFLGAMGVDLGPSASAFFRLGTDPKLGPRTFRLQCDPHGIEIAGGDAAGLWAGVTWLERDMRVRRGAILPHGTVTRSAAWGVQIHQGPWGGNCAVPDFTPDYLDDDAFRLFAHYGVTQMMIYGELLCYTQSRIFPELNHPQAGQHLAMLADAARRAQRFGVGFTYLIVAPRLRPEHPLFRTHPAAKGSRRTAEGKDFASWHNLCTSDPEVRAFYSESMESLFRAVPELGGVIVIVAEESFYHCHMRRWSMDQPCPRCFARTPETVVVEAVEAVAQGVHRVAPRAFVAVWSYLPTQWPDPVGAGYLERYPSDLVFIDQIETNDWIPKGPLRKWIWDYSIDYSGPCDIFRRRIEIAQRRGLPVFVKTETAIGLEMIQYPYVPALQRLADKWQVVRNQHPAGVHQAWPFFGMFGSRAEELGLWAAYGGDIPRDRFLRDMAVRDFGPDAAGGVIQSWAHLSEAVGHIPCLCTPVYYIGPSFLGPAHPLVPTKGDPVPPVFDAVLFYVQESEDSLGTRGAEVPQRLVLSELPDDARVFRVDWTGGGDGYDLLIAGFQKAAEGAQAAWAALREVAARARTGSDRLHFQEELALTELIHRTFVTCANVLAFLYARKQWEQTGDPAHRRTLRRLAHAERENALAAAPLYEIAPWLDLAERNDGRFSRCQDMITEKVRWLESFLGSESETG